MEVLTEFTDKQKEALRFALKPEYKQRALLWPGSIRSGKTYGCTLAIMLHSLKRQDCNYILAGRNSNSIQRNILPYLKAFAKALGIPTHPVMTRNILRVGANEFHMFGANNEKSQDPLQGMTAAGALLDEAALMPQSFLMQVIGRCSDPDAKIFMTLNKTSPFHWIKTELVDKAEEMNIALIESTLDDNPYISDETKAFYAKTLTGHFGKRMLDNEWAAPSGLVYPNHKITPEYYEDPRHVQCAVDWGMSGITAAVYFTKFSNGWVAFDEYYHTGELTCDQHAENILSRYKVRKIFIDSSAVPMRTALRKAGCLVVPSTHDLLHGIQVTDAAMARGNLLISKKCRNLLSEIVALSWDLTAQERGEDKPCRGHDHACDCLRYFAFKKWPPRGHLAPVRKPWSM